MEYRIEHDSMGEVRVPADHYWGAQTQRSVENFPIGVGYETMPLEIIRAFGILKKAAARANFNLGKMDAEKKETIEKACDEVIAVGPSLGFIADQEQPLITDQGFDLCNRDIYLHAGIERLRS